MRTFIWGNNLLLPFALDIKRLTLLFSQCSTAVSDASPYCAKLKEEGAILN